MLAGWFLLRVVRTTCGMFLSQLLVLCWPRLAFFSWWLHHPNLCLHPHRVFSLCVCLSVSKFPPFYRHQSYWIKVHPDHLILTCSSAKTPFPNEMSFTGPESYDFNIFGGGSTSRPITDGYFTSILQMRKLRHREKSNLPKANAPESV